MNGKGSKRRPMQIDREEFEERWNKIFKKNLPGTIKEKKNERIGFPKQSQKKIK